MPFEYRTAQPFEYQTNSCHFEFTSERYNNVRNRYSLHIQKPDHLISGCQNVQYSKESDIWMFGIWIPTVNSPLQVETKLLAPSQNINTPAHPMKQFLTPVTIWIPKTWIPDSIGVRYSMVVTWLGRPFEYQTIWQLNTIYYLKTRLVPYWDDYFILFFLTFQVW